MPASIKNVLIFFVLLLSVHFWYLWWAGSMAFFPLEGQVLWLFEQSSQLLLAQSLWILKALGVDVVQQGVTLYANDMQAHVSVTPECTTLKQWLHWLVIMGFFPGPWRHKLWYIPAGLLVIHTMNLLRITGLLLVQYPFPEGFHFFHDYVFKVGFYVVIFGMWVIWAERFKER